MKKFLLALVTLFAFSGLTMAAVNINTANQKELESLKGIGPVKAKAIVDYRAKHGPFKAIDDLEKVEGVGKATLEEMRHDVTLSGATKVVEQKKDEKPAKKDDDKKVAKEMKKADEKSAKAEAKKAKEEAKPAKGDKKTDEKKDAKK